MSDKLPGAELIAARVLREQAWCWEMYVHGYPYPTIRALAMRSPDDGGLGTPLSVSAIKALVAAHRAEQGQIIGTREERIERRQMEIDAVAMAAKASIRAAAEIGALDRDAAKILLDARAAEAKMHGDDAALRIEADVTTHDAVADELAAMMARAGIEPSTVE